MVLLDKKVVIFLASNLLNVKQIVYFILIMNDEVIYFSIRESIVQNFAYFQSQTDPSYEK